MRSPIGDLPFTLTGVRRDGAHLVVDGELGAWPSRIEIGAADVPGLVAVARRPLALAAAAAALVLLLRRRR